jgi:hypothetical protein
MRHDTSQLILQCSQLQRSVKENGTMVTGWHQASSAQHTVEWDRQDSDSDTT